jgi:hypothetical protein
MKMTMRLFFYFISLLFSFSCFAQSSEFNFEKELDFILYLGQNGQRGDIDFYGEKLLKKESLSISQKDSLKFFMGFINFKWLNYDKSLGFLKEVSDQSIFYPKSVFYSELCYIENKNYSSAFRHLNKIHLDDNNDLLQQLKSFELAGLSLLNRDYHSYDSLSLRINTDNTILIRERQYQSDYYGQLKKLKRKSPFIAGSLSAIVPGLGMVYAGNNGQALAAFLRVAALGALGTETYLKLGPKNPQFIIAASLFSFFYLGNIWGSALSVQIIKNEKLKEIDNNVMVGLRIPIDNFFR